MKRSCVSTSASFLRKLESCAQRDDRAKCCVEKPRALVYRAIKAPDTQRRRRSGSYGYGACVCAYVNDVDDHEEGVGAYFSLVRHSDGHTKCELAGVFLLPTNGWIIRRVQCRGQACRLHAECYKSHCRAQCFLLIPYERFHSLPCVPAICSCSGECAAEALTTLGSNSTTEAWRIVGSY